MLFVIGFFGEAHELMIEALNIFNQVYGPLHPEIVICYRTIARIHYLADDAAQAVSFQKKAVIVSERINGIDHPETMVAYVRMDLFCSFLIPTTDSHVPKFMGILFAIIHMLRNINLSSRINL